MWGHDKVIVFFGFIWFKINNKIIEVPTYESKEKIKIFWDIKTAHTP